MELLIPTALAILVSALSPLIVGALTKASMSAKAKGWVALGISALIAIGWLASTGGFGALTMAGGAGALWQAIGLAIGSAYALQQAVYALMFKGTEFAKSILNNVGVTDGEVDGTGSGFEAELEAEYEPEVLDVETDLEDTEKV